MFLNDRVSYSIYYVHEKLKILHKNLLKLIDQFYIFTETEIS